MKAGRIRTLAVAAAVAMTPACRASRSIWRDPHSHAEPDRVAVNHLDLELTIDFKTQQLSGAARLTLTRADRTAPLVVDDDGLAIDAVQACGQGATPLAHRLGTAGNGGQALIIDLADHAVDCVEIRYRVSPSAGALLWVDPVATGGGTKPMLFTQSQAILARTWIPLQDTPGVRFTYEATIHAPADLMALMSAENPQVRSADGTYHFKQLHPIPSYLMALAVGDFEFRPVSPRSGIYAEPSMVDRAAYEFAEVEDMMRAAEKLYGAYRWGRYDMLVLPSSFPYGGMENPNLTFLNPTVITGDRALVSLVAHELAHSWSGNLATNSNWGETWLNEGITSYVEIRIMEELRGAEYASVLWWITGRAVQRTIEELTPFAPATRLAIAYGSDTPVDEIADELAYDKGSLFALTLERTYGRAQFDAFMRGWFDRHAFQAVNTQMFIEEASSRLGNRVDLGAWLYGSGLPADAAATLSIRADSLESAARDLAARGTVPDASGWSSLDWSVFIRSLPPTITRGALDALDARYHLTDTKNAEIAMHWLAQLVEVDARDRTAPVQAYLMTVGRKRNTVRLYETMVGKNEFWKTLAKQTFEQAKSRYHPVTRDTISKLVTP